MVEKLADDKGLVWPENVAPYKVYLVNIGEQGAAMADDLYMELEKADVEVLYDDRDARPGEKFADAELMGVPYRITASDRLAGDKKFEFTERSTGETVLLTADELIAKLK